MIQMLAAWWLFFFYLYQRHPVSFLLAPCFAEEMYRGHVCVIWSNQHSIFELVRVVFEVIVLNGLVQNVAKTVSNDVKPSYICS